MSTKTTQSAPAGFSFRPESYWDDPDPLAAILRNIKSSNRRKMITDYWKAGKIDELDPAHLEDETEFSITPEASESPLTLGELVHLIDTVNGGRSGGLGQRYNIANLSDWTGPETLRHFTTVNSTFYSGLFDHYDAIHEQWMQETLEAREKEDEEEGKDD